VASLTYPVISLSAGGACALAAMLVLVLARPQVLGNEAQSALGRLIPAFAPRFAGAPDPEGQAR
jgi:hypothetical protein